MQLPSATPDFATASMIVCPISGVINRIAAPPSTTERVRNSRRDKDGATRTVRMNRLQLVWDS